MLAGLKDIARSASSLSFAQTIALAATGLIWSRYSLVIIPRNWNLFSVNAFVALTQLVQLGRLIHYHYFTEPDPISDINMFNISSTANDLIEDSIAMANLTLPLNLTTV